MDHDLRHRLRSEIRSLLSTTVEHMGFEIVAIEFGSDRRGTILRLYIDGPHGVGIRDCKRVTHAVSPELDVSDPLPGTYQLEVSSPGIERPVQTSRDFMRFRGLRAKVRMVPGSGRKRYSGVLDGLDDGAVRLLVGGELQLLPHTSIDRVHLDLDLDEFQRLGEGKLPSAEGEAS